MLKHKTIAFALLGTFMLVACRTAATRPNTPPTLVPPTAAETLASPIAPSSPSMTTIPASNVPRVKIQSGELEGVCENGVNVFKGIPNAEPPVGELRWREPQPAASWDDVRQADTFGSVCIQPEAKIEGAGAEGPQSEDCIYLNVWTPNTDPGAKLPVMVWIHGGALVIGSGSLPMYDGAPLAERGAVVVTLNYRLAPLGFFSHPALDQAIRVVP
jgi:para-nitrobenzyl esterase